MHVACQRRQLQLKVFMQLFAAAVAGSPELCFTQSWDACSCDTIKCNNSAACVAKCDSKLASHDCSKISAVCEQYDALTCGTWCSDQRASNFSCSRCRSPECEPFCHGSPSCCKFDLCPVSATRCGDCWPLTCARWGVPREHTVRALGEPDGSITESSLTQALSKWNTIMQEELGVLCDCTNHVGLRKCMETDLCSAITGLINATHTSSLYQDAVAEFGFDKRCCAFCDLSSVHGICWDAGEGGSPGPQWGPVNHYDNMVNRIRRLLQQDSTSIEL